MRLGKRSNWIVLMMLCVLLYGCGEPAAVQDQNADSVFEESENSVEVNVSENSGTENISENNTENDSASTAGDSGHSYYSEYVMGAEDSIISAKGEILNVSVGYRDYIGLLSGKMLYPDLQEALQEVSGLWREEINEIEEQDRSVSVTLDIHRADAYALSFVRRVWNIGKDDKSLTYQGCHYDTTTGEELALADVITDTEGYAAVMAEELAGKYPLLAEQDGLTEVLKELLDNETPEWTIGYQALTFYLPEELLEEAGIADTSSDENGYYIISVPYDSTMEIVAADCMQIPEAYAVSFETAVLPADESNLSLWQWRTGYDLDGDGLEEEITIDYTSGRVVGEWQAVFRIDGKECIFDGNGEDISNRNTPYLIIGEDGTAYIALYMVGNLDGSGYIAVAKVSDDEVEPLYQGFAYLDSVRLTDPEHILSGGMVWDEIENLTSAYYTGVAGLYADGWHEASGRNTFFSGYYLETAGEIELPLVDPVTAERTGETEVLGEGTALQLLWIEFNSYLDCLTEDGKIVRIEYSGTDESGNWILTNGESSCLKDICNRYFD